MTKKFKSMRFDTQNRCILCRNFELCKLSALCVHFAPCTIWMSDVVLSLDLNFQSRLIQHAWFRFISAIVSFKLSIYCCIFAKLFTPQMSDNACEKEKGIVNGA